MKFYTAFRFRLSLTICIVFVATHIPRGIAAIKPGGNNLDDIKLRLEMDKRMQERETAKQIREDNTLSKEKVLEIKASRTRRQEQKNTHLREQISKPPVNSQNYARAVKKKRHTPNFGMTGIISLLFIVIAGIIGVKWSPSKRRNGKDQHHSKLIRNTNSGGNTFNLESDQ